MTRCTIRVGDQWVGINPLYQLTDDSNNRAFAASAAVVEAIVARARDYGVVIDEYTVEPEEG